MCKLGYTTNPISCCIFPKQPPHGIFCGCLKKGRIQIPGFIKGYLDVQNVCLDVQTGLYNKPYLRLHLPPTTSARDILWLPGKKTNRDTSVGSPCRFASASSCPRNTGSIDCPARGSGAVNGGWGGEVEGVLRWWLSWRSRCYYGVDIRSLRFVEERFIWSKGKSWIDLKLLSEISSLLLIRGRLFCKILKNSLKIPC